MDIAFASTPQDASSLSTFRCFDTHSIFVAAADYDCNFDHIYTLEEIIRFPLILLERKASSRLHLENAPLPDGETASRMVQLGLDTAHRLGMKPYYLYRQKYMAGNQENVGYALPGHACQYNVDIMEETTHILALGAGGISKRVYPEEGHIGRAPNVSNIEQYIARVEEMIGRKKALFLPEMPL